MGDLAGTYSWRINIQHRLVYQVVAEEHVVKVLRMWSHDESDGHQGRWSGREDLAPGNLPQRARPTTRSS